MVDQKKKRIADKQLRSDEVENYEDEIQDEDGGEFKRAQAEVLAKRKIVKAKRSGSRGLVPENINQAEEPTPQVPAWPSFTTSSTTTSTNGKEETPKKENGKEQANSTPSKSTEEKKETPEVKKVFGDFSWVSKSSSEADSKGTKSSTSAPLFSFSSFSSNTEKQAPLFPAFESNTKSIFGFNVDAKATSGEFPSFSSSPETKREKPYLPPAEPVKTGEEEEQHVFQTRAKLFTLVTDKAESKNESKWKERGVGNIRVNVSQDGNEARLVMRVDASLRLILNSRIWPNMVVEKAGSKEIRFIGTSIDTNEITTFLIRVSRPEVAEELLKAIGDQKELVSPPKSKEEEEKK